MYSTPSSPGRPKRLFTVSSPSWMTSLTPTQVVPGSGGVPRPACCARRELAPSARITSPASILSSPAMTPQTFPSSMRSPVTVILFMTMTPSSSAFSQSHWSSFALSTE